MDSIHLLELITQIGVIPALFVFLMYRKDRQDAARERRLGERLDEMQSKNVDILSTTVHRNTIALTEVSAAHAENTQALREHTTVIRQLSEKLTVTRNSKES